MELMATRPNPVENGASERVARRPVSFDATLASATASIAFRETVRLAVDSFRASKVRFLLTMLGMIIGSASIILVVTVGLTGKQYALDTISSIGPNKVEMLYSGGTVSGPDNTSAPDYMTREDMKAVVAQVPGVVYASPMLEFHDRISIGGGVTQESMFLGVSPQYKDIRNFRILAGRFFDDEDAAAHTKAAVILGSFATKLFGSPQAAINQQISVIGIPFTVVGVFAERVGVAQGIDEIGDQTILIPYEVARYFTGTDTVKEIFFSMADAETVPMAARQITDIIQSRHRPTSVYKADTLVEILSDMAKIATMLTIVLSLGGAADDCGIRRWDYELDAGERECADAGDRDSEVAGGDKPGDPDAVFDRGCVSFAGGRADRHGDWRAGAAGGGAGDAGEDSTFAVVGGDCAWDFGDGGGDFWDAAGESGGEPGSGGDVEVRVGVGL